MASAFSMLISPQLAETETKAATRVTDDGRTHRIASVVKIRIYRLARRFLYRFAIPMVSRVGPLDSAAQRLVRTLVQHPIFASKVPNPMHVGGLTLFHSDTRLSLTVRALSLGSYEPSVMHAFRSSLSAGAGVVDLGAHIGYHTLLAARLVRPDGHVWAFEPDPDNRQLLQRNVEANGMQDLVTVVPQAVGRDVGTAVLHRHNNDSGGSHVEVARSGADDVNVQVTTLDDWGAANRWPSVALVKIDIEGAEPDAICGMRELAKRNLDLVLIVECQEEVLQRSGANAMRLFESLSDLGFDSIEVLDDQRGTYPLGGATDAAAVLRQSRWYPINLLCRRDGGASSSRS